MEKLTKTSRWTKTLACNDEMFEMTFDWMMSKVLSCAMLFFILAVAAQWAGIKADTSEHATVQNERSRSVWNTGPVTLADSKPLRPRLSSAALPRFDSISKRT
jgi:hypothetical protein